MTDYTVANTADYCMDIQLTLPDWIVPLAQQWREPVDRAARLQLCRERSCDLLVGAVREPPLLRGLRFLDLAAFVAAVQRQGGFIVDAGIQRGGVDVIRHAVVVVIKVGVVT
mgnify:CR=1 FL=1